MNSILLMSFNRKTHLKLLISSNQMGWPFGQPQGNPENGTIGSTFNIPRVSTAFNLGQKTDEGSHLELEKNYEYGWLKVQG